jgi:hypothetical protein
VSLRELHARPPKGLVAALAKERLAAQKRDELHRRHVTGLAALESAAAQVQRPARLWFTDWSHIERLVIGLSGRTRNSDADKTQILVVWVFP